MSDLSHPPLADTLAAELLAAIAVPAWLYSEGVPLIGNSSLERLSGQPAQALAAMPHLSLVLPEFRDELAGATDDCLHGSGQPQAQWTRLVTADGNWRPVELTLRRVRWGQRNAALVTCIDLSDIHHVQYMLQDMASMVRQIVDGAPVATFVIDSNHRVTHWNEACCRLTGRSAEDMIGSKDHWQPFYDAPRPMLADLIVEGQNPAQALAALGETAVPSVLVAGSWDTEAFFPALGTEGRWLQFTSAPLHSREGQVIGAIMSLQDTSQRRRTESELTRRLEQMVAERSAELAASAQVMDAFIDNAPMGVVYARGAQVLRANRHMSEIFGNAAAPPANGADFHLDPADAQAIRTVARPLLRQGQPLHHEMWLHHASGRPVWAQVNAYVVDPQRPEAGTWWMLQDRTEVRAAQEALHARLAELKATNRQLEQAQNQLLQSDKMASIGQLAAGVAHEINNPVGFVSSNLHTLRQYVDTLLGLVDAYAGAYASTGEAAGAGQGEAAARLAQQLRTAELDYLKEDLPQLMAESADGLARVKKIVQDLKDFSRVDQSDWQQADLNAGLESTLNVVRHEVKYKCEVVKHLAPLPLVMCLAGQLNQVFMNLIVNASQAISAQGVITLSSGVQDGWVWVQVDDTGCGMSEEVRRRIFEPFYTTKDVGKGTGLGLSLSFSIVKRHGGVIRVASTPGVGSSFRVWVPVAGPGAEGGPPGTPPQSANGL